MSTVGYVKNSVDKSYGSNAINYVKAFSNEIINVLDIVGVSVGAIAGAMAEEKQAYDFTDSILDDYAKSGLTGGEVAASLGNAIIDDDIGGRGVYITNCIPPNGPMKNGWQITKRSREVM